MKRAFAVITLLIVWRVLTPAQHSVDGYIPETDPLVQAKLTAWQDLKVGLFMHWGLYSQWGIEASWSYCSEDNGWNPREHGRFQDYDLYKQDYRDLRKVFNPTRFDPVRWARAAREAGMRYLVFTTKHHDGFCMFDTKTTEYKITAEGSAFHSDPRADITKAVFDAFRTEGFMIGAYFSKPDWSSNDYWWPYFATPDRHVNYDPAKYPERWKSFTDYTFRQIEELMTGYGTVDILWMDGGWVRPISNIPKRFEDWAKKNNWNQDIDIERIARMGRSHQPGLLVVDRTVAGRFENYVTPEGSVPDDPITVPWETCLMMGSDQWSYKPGQVFLPARTLIHTLVDNVSKGGNMLLDIGPSPEGEWADSAYARLRELGAWMKVNDEAIYGSRFVRPFKEGRIRLTQNRITKAVYAVYLADRDETVPPRILQLDHVQPAPGTVVTMLGVEESLKWKPEGNGCSITIPAHVVASPPCQHAWTLKITKTR